MLSLVLVQHILLSRDQTILLHTYEPYKTREGGWGHCSKFFGYKQTQGNNQERLKR